MNVPETPKQRTVTIKTEGKPDVVVRRMYWKRKRDFLKSLAKHMSTGLSGVTTQEQILARMSELVVSVDELATYMVEHCTDLNSAAIDELDFVQFLQVLEAAVTLNLGEETKNSLAVIGATLAKLMPAMKTTNGAESTLT